MMSQKENYVSNISPGEITPFGTSLQNIKANKYWSLIDTFSLQWLSEYRNMYIINIINLFGV